MGILNGIGEEVEQHLCNPVPVHHNPDFLIGAYHIQSDARFHFQAMHFLHFVNQSGHFDQLEVHFRFSRLNAGKVQNVIYELQQQVAILLDDVQVFGFLHFIFRQSYDFRESHDSIQRSADFVAHIGQEHRFHAVGLFGALLRLDEFIGALHPVTDIVYQCHHFIIFERSDACLEIMPFAIIHIQGILYLLQLPIFEALTYVP